MEIKFDMFEKAFNEQKKKYESTLTAQDVWTRIHELKHEGRVQNAINMNKHNKKVFEETGVRIYQRPTKYDHDLAYHLRTEKFWKIKDIAKHFGVNRTNVSKMLLKRGANGHTKTVGK